MKAIVAVAAALSFLACHHAEQPPPVQSGITSHAPVPKPLEGKPPERPKREPITRDLDAIREAGVLKAIFTFNSTGYFVYRGETMGYEYELLSLFAREAKLRLQPAVVRDSKLL